MFTVLRLKCWAIVLFIRSFVLLSPRCRRCRSLLKVPYCCFISNFGQLFWHCLWCVWRQLLWMKFQHFSQSSCGKTKNNIILVSIREMAGDRKRFELVRSSSSQAWLMTTRETGPNKYVTQRCCKLFVGNSGCQFRNCFNSAESAVFSYLIYHKWQDKDKFDHHDGTFVLKSILGHICLNSRITKKTNMAVYRTCLRCALQGLLLFVNFAVPMGE